MASSSGHAPRSERRIGSDRTPVGIHIATGAVVVLAAMMLAAMLPTTSGAWRLVPVATALFAIAAFTVDPIAVAAVAVLAYLLVIGFLVNRFGELTWHGTPDAYRLLAIAVPAGIGLLFGVVRRWRRRPQPLIVPPEWGVVNPANLRALPLTNLTLTNEEEFPGG